MVTEISTLQELQDINNNLSGNYVLTSDIDASDTENWNKLNWRGTWQSDTTYSENDYIEESGNYYYMLQYSYTSGSSFDSSQWIETTKFTGGSADDGEALGWRPLGGDFLARFTGSFDGQGHTISDLYINRGIEDSEDFTGVGLFGRVEGGDIQNISVINTNITGECRAGGLVGNNWDSEVSNSYSTGTVSGADFVGGLVGYNRDSTVSNSYSTGDVSGEDRVGGLVGHNNDSSTVSNSYATGDVSGDNRVGGLVGNSWDSEVSNSYSTGTVSGDSDVGGLVGRNYVSSTVSNSYSTGDVSGDNRVGGLVGYNRDSTVSNSYSTRDVSGDSDVGGMVGRIFNFSGETDKILYSYANSDINPSLDLIGSTNINGTLDTTGSSLKTTAEMTDYENDYPDAYEGWTFTED